MSDSCKYGSALMCPGCQGYLTSQQNKCGNCGLAIRWEQVWTAFEDEVAQVSKSCPKCGGCLDNLWPHITSIPYHICPLCGWSDKPEWKPS